MNVFLNSAFNGSIGLFLAVLRVVPMENSRFRGVCVLTS